MQPCHLTQRGTQWMACESLTFSPWVLMPYVIVSCFLSLKFPSSQNPPLWKPPPAAPFSSWQVPLLVQASSLSPSPTTPHRELLTPRSGWGPSVICIITTPLLACGSSYQGQVWLVCSSLYPKHLSQCLTDSRLAISKCWVNEWDYFDELQFWHAKCTFLFEHPQLDSCLISF